MCHRVDHVLLLLDSLQESFHLEKLRLQQVRLLGGFGIKKACLLRFRDSLTFLHARILWGVDEGYVAHLKEDGMLVSGIEGELWDRM